MNEKELELFEVAMDLAIDESYSGDAEDIKKLEIKIKLIDGLYKAQKEVIDKAKSLNHEISHIIYEDFLEENIIGSKLLYERLKKQLSILEDKEVPE